MALSAATRRGRRVRPVWLVLGAVVSLVLVLFLSPTGRYLARAGLEEAKILRARRAISELLSDPRTDSLTRARLRLVLDGRAFAEDSLGLQAGESFTTFSKLERDTLVLVLSGARRDRLVLHTWWFPIVGRVPYKGFFDFVAAEGARQELAARGYDTNLRPASAFSTLGWFNDPLLSTTIRQDSIELVNTVVHEITHATFYAPGQAIFNESFANFAGERGAQHFFRSRGQHAVAAEALARWEDEKILGRFWAELYHVLDSAFAAHPEDRPARLALRDSIYRRARIALLHDVAPRLKTVPPPVLERTRLDNAALLARRVYLTGLDLFDSLYVQQGRDLRTAIARAVELAKLCPELPFNGVRYGLAAAAAASPERLDEDECARYGEPPRVPVEEPRGLPLQ